MIYLRKTYKNTLAAPLALAFTVVTLSSCNRSAAAPGATSKAMVPESVTVAVARAEIRPMADRLTVSSELVPFQEIDVFAKEAGYVKTLSVDYGSHVRKDQVMAVLEIPELEALLEVDQASIKARQDEAIRAEHEVARAKAQHEVYQLQYTRLAGVAKTQVGLVAQQEVDDAQGKDLASESQLEAAQGALDTARSEIEVARSKLAHDKTLYDYSRITAPFDGVVTQRYANLGALMQAGTSNTQSTPLVRLSQENLYRLVIPVPESDVKYIRIGDPVEVKISSTGETVTGKVSRFSVDVTMETRTMHTEVDVPNPKGSLLPGMYAEATLTLNQRPNAITVPIQAIDREGERTSVMVVGDGGAVQRRAVTPGVQTPTFVEIAGGLAPGETVVVSDRTGLKPGQRVLSHAAAELAYDSGGASGADTAKP
jgi:RND family efflux transporter MFP subunit